MVHPGGVRAHVQCGPNNGHQRWDVHSPAVWQPRSHLQRPDHRVCRGKVSPLTVRSSLPHDDQGDSDGLGVRGWQVPGGPPLHAWLLSLPLLLLVLGMEDCLSCNCSGKLINSIKGSLHSLWSTTLPEIWNIFMSSSEHPPVHCSWLLWQHLLWLWVPDLGQYRGLDDHLLLGHPHPHRGHQEDLSGGGLPQGGQREATLQWYCFNSYFPESIAVSSAHQWLGARGWRSQGVCQAKESTSAPGPEIRTGHHPPPEWPLLCWCGHRQGWRLDSDWSARYWDNETRVVKMEQR